MKGRVPLPSSDKAIPNVDIEYDVSTSLPEPPEWLHPYGKEEWHSLIQILVDKGVFSDVDISAYTIYCSTYAEWRIIDETIQAEGGPIMAPKSRFVTSKIHPGVAMRDRLSKNMLQYLKAFGLTPASRKHVKVPKNPSEAETDIDTFIG